MDTGELLETLPLTAEDMAEELRAIQEKEATA